MKVIISHDVDHITFWEHNKDLIVPKLIARGLIEFGLGYISASEIMARLKSIIQNKWQNLEELMEFDKENNIPSVFFIGVSNGKGLNYTIKDAEYWAKKILKEGFSVGVHGIAFENLKDVQKEYARFKSIRGLEKFGIRMHYLRRNTETLSLLSEVGYLYDCSVFQMKNPYKIGRLWEFPLHIMDGYLFCKDSRWQNQNLKQSKEATKRIIEDAFKKGINFFTILFHDSYFSDSFKIWKEWYIWLITYLKDRKFKFISYNEAIKELESIYG